MGAWFRAHTVAVLVSAAVILVAIIGVALFALNNSASPTATISQVTYSQTQAGTNTKPVDVVVTSSTKIAELQQLLTTYNITPGVTDTVGDAGGCVGGLTSNVKLEYSDGTSAEFSTYVCGKDSPKFSVALSDLLVSWAK